MEKKVENYNLVIRLLVASIRNNIICFIYKFYILYVQNNLSLD